MKTVNARRAGLGLFWISGLALGGFLLWAWRSAIDPIEPPAVQSFDASTIRRGAELAAIGGCATCHTAPGGEPFAGGLAIPTPFGTIYSTNITPDPTTGIGRWSRAAFQRAMRDGVDREGRHLYPAFPYDHFTLVSDADNSALYAFLMTRQAVQVRPPGNQLPFPVNMRILLAGWKLLFFRRGPYAADATHDDQWNRGAYLAKGLGHCGACHTPRNELGAEISAQDLGGGDSEGWHAYAINSESAAREPWDAQALLAFFREGWHDRHGDAHGPMAPVTRNLASAPDADTRALADYIAWKMTKPLQPDKPADQPASEAAAEIHASAETNTTGAAIYSAACASCHDGTRPMPFGGIKLALSTAVTGESATNLINVVLDGLHPPAGTTGAIMPGFASSLTDGQLESLIAYVRSSFGGKPPWTSVESSVREARSRDRD
jgi:mono/diheme cytochrome c family protein